MVTATAPQQSKACYDVDYSGISFLILSIRQTCLTEDCRKRMEEWNLEHPTKRWEVRYYDTWQVALKSLEEMVRNTNHPALNFKGSILVEGAQAGDLLNAIKRIPALKKRHVSAIKFGRYPWDLLPSI